MNAPLRRFALVSAVAVVSMLGAPAANSQQSRSPSDDVSPVRMAPAGPTLDGASAGVKALPGRPLAADESEAAMQTRLGLGQARALMVVGFAAVVIGLLVGDGPGTLIAIVGAGVGLYGLYHYLK